MVCVCVCACAMCVAGFPQLQHKAGQTLSEESCLHTTVSDSNEVGAFECNILYNYMYVYIHVLVL